MKINTLFVFSLVMLGCQTTTYSVITEESDFQNKPNESLKIKSMYNINSLNLRMRDTLVSSLTLYDFEDHSYDCKKIEVRQDSVMMMVGESVRMIDIDLVKSIQVSEKYYRDSDENSAFSIVMKSVAAGLILFMVPDIKKMLDPSDNESELKTEDKLLLGSAGFISALIYQFGNDYYKSYRENIIFSKFIPLYVKEKKI